jgi:hypothetical protein
MKALTHDATLAVNRQARACYITTGAPCGVQLHALAHMQHTCSTHPGTMPSQVNCALPMATPLTLADRCLSSGYFDACVEVLEVMHKAGFGALFRKSKLAIGGVTWIIDTFAAKIG